MAKLTLKLRQIIFDLCIHIIYKLEKDNITQELNRRVELVGSFLHQNLAHLNSMTEKVPIIDSYIPTIIENGSFNYFPLPDGSIPRFDFVSPEIPLFVYIGGPSSAKFEVARNLGVKKVDWEMEQSKIAAIEKQLPIHPQMILPAHVKLMILRWDDPCTEGCILARLQELLDVS